MVTQMYEEACARLKSLETRVLLLGVKGHLSALHRSNGTDRMNSQDIILVKRHTLSMDQKAMIADNGKILFSIIEWTEPIPPRLHLPMLPMIQVKLSRHLSPAIILITITTTALNHLFTSTTIQWALGRAVVVSCS